MKAVLVGTIDGESRFFYIVDAKSRKSDGVVDDGSKPRVVDFWSTAMNARNLVPLRSTKFHDFLWDGASWENSDEWERIFVNKTQDVSPKILSGVTISTDAMKSKVKEKSINSRASEFKTSMQTQNLSMIRNRIGRG